MNGRNDMPGPTAPGLHPGRRPAGRRSRASASTTPRQAGSVSNSIEECGDTHRLPATAEIRTAGAGDSLFREGRQTVESVAALRTLAAATVSLTRQRVRVRIFCALRGAVSAQPMTVAPCRSFRQVIPVSRPPVVTLARLFQKVHLSPHSRSAPEAHHAVIATNPGISRLDAAERLPGRRSGDLLPDGGDGPGARPDQCS